MAKYGVTYSCGHSDTVVLFGKHSERDRKIEWFENFGLCSECYAKEQEAKRQRELEELKSKASETGLPELTGSQKQINWAMSIRAKFAEQWPVSNSTTIHIRDAILSNTSASWWIENRASGMLEFCSLAHKIINPILAYFGIEDVDDMDLNAEFESKGILQIEPADLFFLLNEFFSGRNVVRGILPTQEEREVEAEVKAKTAADSTIEPEVRASDIPATISKLEKDGVFSISFRSPRNEALRGLLRRMGFSWAEDHWGYRTKGWTDDMDNRLVEIGVTALSEGFRVKMTSPELATRVKGRDYELYNSRRIVDRGGIFGISWEKQHDGDFYDASKRIKGAKWDRERKIVTAPAKAYEEVLDFASTYDFTVSAKAKKLAGDAKEAILKAVPPKQLEQPAPPSDTPPVLDIPEEVPADETLRDTN